MHYRFQHVLKFSFQHALQISEHSEMNHCVENYIKNFKACLKPCQAFQGVLKHSFQNALQISTRFEI